jgi:Protein of unknown function (DUF2380)
MVPKAVVADFSYSDTSGEVRDQSGEHAIRLRAFNEKLRSDLAEANVYNLVSLKCPAACPSADTSLPGLIMEVRRVGADVVVFGGIHKESTLIQWAKVVVMEVRTEKVIIDRLLTFRADSDEAWLRAEAYIAREIAGLRKTE